MSNPRNYLRKSTDISVTGCFLITPNDSADLAIYAVALRVWNSNATVATVAVETVDGDSVTLSFPPTSTLIEPLYVAKVLATGTSSGLIIHGYK